MTENQPAAGNALGRSGAGGGGSDDYQMLLTVIAGIALGVAATAMPGLVEGPFTSWIFAAKLVMWLTGVAAASLLFALIWGDAPPLALFIASSFALAIVIFANVHQNQVRTKLAESGAI